MDHKERPRRYVEIPLQTDTMIMAIILGSWPLPVGRANLVGDYTAHEDIHGQSDGARKERGKQRARNPPF